MHVHSWFNALQDLLFPPTCLGCSRRLDHSRPPLFCADCLQELSFIDSPFCPCCGTPYTTGVDHLCGLCLQGKYNFDLARSLFLYERPVSEIILRLKFTGNLSGLQSLQSLCQQSPRIHDFTTPDVMVPVPLHSTRLRHRGFNQAVLLARACFPQWQHLLRFDLLQRLHATTPQSHLSGQQRRNNLQHGFSVPLPQVLRGKSVLLIDDVMTTGSTVHECARALRRGGASRVEVFSIARSIGDGHN